MLFSLFLFLDTEPRALKRQESVTDASCRKPVPSRSCQENSALAAVWYYHPDSGQCEVTLSYPECPLDEGRGFPTKNECMEYCIETDPHNDDENQEDQLDMLLRSIKQILDNLYDQLSVVLKNVHGGKTGD